MKFIWNPELYDKKHDFVSQYGEEIVDLLSPKKQETVLDLGCGTGDLSHKISTNCKSITGIDKSPEMIESARNKYPEIEFKVADIIDFSLNEKFDAVFSNAVLHWIPQAEKVIQNVSRHLKRNGRFVAEFGGKGCVNNIITALIKVLDDYKIEYPPVYDVLYYPSIGEYSTLLEQNGFELQFAVLFDRPTVLKDGIDGMYQFIEMFFPWLFSNTSETLKEKIINAVSEALKPTMFKEDSWLADYRRIRISALKIREI